MPLPPPLRRPIAGLAIAALALVGCTTGENANDTAGGPRTSPGGAAAGVGPEGTTGLDNGSQGNSNAGGAAPGQ